MRDPTVLPKGRRHADVEAPGRPDAIFMMRKTLVVLLDILIVAVLAAIAVIVISGGGTFQLGAQQISARSVGNPLIALYVLLALRLALRGLEEAAAASLRLCDRAWRRLSALSGRQALMAAGACVLMSTALKIFNAIAYFGFYSGDDVEIHEMTMSALFGLKWPVWELRNAFYPFTFIYPAQALCLRLGVSDPSRLVIAGRLVVVVFSSLTLVILYRTGRRHYGTAAAVLAVVFLGLSRLHVTFGGSELPRPVAACFLCAAFACILAGRSAAAAVAGILLGVAASLRFSEAVFLAPAVGQLLLARRAGDAAIVVVVCAGTAAAILGVSDAVYWGRPFFSLQNIVDYTLVRKLSSRGYEPVYYYVTHVGVWSNLFIVALALYTIRIRAWAVALWIFAPLCLLSLLPHKEARYLIPITPFLALGAAVSLVHLLERSTIHRYVALLLVVGFSTSLIFEAGGFRFRRSEDGVRVARFVAAQPDVRAVAAEQLWQLGGRIYLKQVPVLIDMAPERIGDPSYVSSILAANEPRWLALGRQDYERHHYQSLLGAAGFAEAPVTTSDYVLLRR
jgi:hypothetical protein